ncbi:uncharacterized protein LOC114119560 isoform X1 [Aphis gossypii]|uniref:uncharacterized protein LOC114119560 isoform X1 n=1 Tax=Aphis gossypii TaxID=80765 RepID=UPI00215981D3|nr:uncharacterized protein LOC114119560 isoform X1 [Aphis gossypii]
MFPMDSDNPNYNQNRCGSGRLIFRTENRRSCRGCRDNSWDMNRHDSNCTVFVDHTNTGTSTLLDTNTRESTLNTEGSTRLDTNTGGSTSLDTNNEHPRRVGASGDSYPTPDLRPSPSIPNKVLLVHGLDRELVNCDRVFNLFCLYGNVTTVKILKDDKVLVEMEDVEAARRCVSNLHMLQLDDMVNMKVKYSKHNFIHDQVNFNKLADGTPAQKVYLSSTLNRFVSNVLCLDKRRIAAPSKILHFFNAPTDVCGIAIHRAISDALCRSDAIRSITILPKKPKAKCSTGLIELKSMALAAKTVLLSNHMTIESTVSRFPFLTKLCFSKWSEIEQKPSDLTTLRFCSVPRTPWLLHKSEHGVPTTEFPLSCTTVMNGGGDCMWTLWVISDTQKHSKQHQQQTPLAVQESVVEESAVSMTDAATDCDSTCPSNRIVRRNLIAANDSDSVIDIIDMLRNRLCDIRNDRGDAATSADSQLGDA